MTKRLLFGFGELAITFSVLILGYVAYELWFTNLSAEQKASQITEELVEKFDAAPPLQSESNTEVLEIPRTPGKGFALLYVPRLRDDVWATPIVSGTSQDDLSKGVGHYTSTEQPGELGNFAIAGHRATNGEPFAKFEKLRAGDLVFVRTEQAWFTYELVQDQKVPNSALWVLEDRPNGVEIDGDRLLTLTTCDPRWNSTQRWAWWGVLRQKSPAPPEGVITP